MAAPARRRERWIPLRSAEVGGPAGGRQAPAGGQATQQTQGGGDARGEGEERGDEFKPISPPEGALAAALWRGFTSFAGPLAQVSIQLSGTRGLGRTVSEEIVARTGVVYGRDVARVLQDPKLRAEYGEPGKRLKEWSELVQRHAPQVFSETGAGLLGAGIGLAEAATEWKHLLGPVVAKGASLAGAGFERVLEKVGLVAREKRVYAPEKVEVITAQQGDVGAMAWKLGKPTKDITEKWVMGSPVPRTISPEVPYYKVPVGLKDHGAVLKVGELPFSLHPSALRVSGGGVEAVATLTRKGGAAVLKGLPVEPFPYADKQTLSVIFPWEKAAGGAGSGGMPPAAPLARLPPPSGGAAAAVPTGGGGLLSLEKLSTTLGGATGGVPSATLVTVTRVAPLPVTLPALSSLPQAQRQEAGAETVVRRSEDTVPVPERKTEGATVAIPMEKFPTLVIPMRGVVKPKRGETVVRRGDETVLRRDEDTVPRITGEETVLRVTGEETVVRRGDETVLRRDEDTVPRRGDETLPRRDEDTVPVPERKTGGATGGSTAVIPAEQFPTVTIPTEKSPTVAIPRKTEGETAARKPEGAAPRTAGEETAPVTGETPKKPSGLRLEPL